MKKVIAMLIALCACTCCFVPFGLAQQSYPFSGYPDWVYADKVTPTSGYMRSTSYYNKSSSIAGGRGFILSVSSKNKGYKYVITTSSANYYTGAAITPSGHNSPTVSDYIMGSAFSGTIHDIHLIASTNNTAQNGYAYQNGIGTYPTGIALTNFSTNSVYSSASVVASIYMENINCN